MMPGDSHGFASVVFDFDSTLSAIEGIDFLAGPRREQVREMTDRAMSGEVPLDAVYGERLRMIRPTAAELDRLASAYVDALVPDAAGTIAALRWLGKSIRVVSGGLLAPVLAAASHLGLRREEIAAVAVQHGPAGEYLGYDLHSPLARAGGKEEVIRAWGLPRPSLLVGDGATDLEARPAVDAFAAFMGVEQRPAIAAAAEFVISSRSIAPVLELVATPAELVSLRGTHWAPLLDIGAAPAGPIRSE